LITRHEVLNAVKEFWEAIFGVWRICRGVLRSRFLRVSNLISASETRKRLIRTPWQLLQTPVKAFQSPGESFSKLRSSSFSEPPTSFSKANINATEEGRSFIHKFYQRVVPSVSLSLSRRSTEKSRSDGYFWN
jgi:hypothetical protein